MEGFDVAVRGSWARFLHTHPTRRAGWNWVIWAVVVVAALGAAGNATGTSKHPRTSRVAPVVAAAPSTAAPSPTPTHAPVVSSRPAATRSSHRVRPAAPAGIVVNAAGAVLPDPHRTPGAVNPDVTQANIHATICVPGWTATVRPASSYTTDLKIHQLATGYAYHGDRNPGDYEEDHLVSLELGGSPTAAANLWPEPYFATRGARAKDRIENTLHALVCSGLVSLATAQHAIAANWWVAFNVFAAGAAPAPRPSTTPRPTPAPVTAPGNGATALCNDGTNSYAAHHQGACSHHGGVKIFYK